MIWRFEIKERKKNKDKNEFQDILDTIHENPFGYLFKPLNNVKDFPDKKERTLIHLGRHSVHF